MSDEELLAAMKDAMRAGNWCGATHIGEQVCCDDARLPNEIRQRCQCSADAIAALNVLRASGRLVPAVEGDVVEVARIAVMGPDAGCLVLDGRPHGQRRLVLGKGDVRRVIALAAPFIAAATEARVREECAALADSKGAHIAADAIRKATR